MEPELANTEMSPGTRLRALFTRPQVRAPFVFDGLQARCAERAGFEVVYVTGFGTAASRALPDLGLLGMAEMAAAVGIVTSATSLPVVADADTGYGGVLNVARTVRAYETAGVAGLHLEDQMWPKRCGFLEGKEVVPVTEMVAKIRTACAARHDDATVIIARTDALATHGWDEAELRVRRYYDHGADLVFVDGIRTDADLDEYQSRLDDLPLVYNGIGQTRNAVDGRGVVLQLDGNSFMAVVAAVEDIFTKMANGTADELRTTAFPVLRELLGVDSALAFVSSSAQEAQL